MHNYLTNIWGTRYFWIHLALSDLRSRWRRSFFGIFWSMIQPLGMTLILASVFTRLFKTDMTTYAPYMFSGIIIWEFISVCLTTGSQSFVQAESYIKQCAHPLAIYTLRTIITSIIVFLMASFPLIVWVTIVMPQNFGLCWLASLVVLPLLILILWPLSTLVAYIGARFRDLAPALTLILQALWFISPVYFEEKMFRDGGLDKLIDYNPVYHLLQIIRAPLLSGEWPQLENYMFCLGTACIFTIIAFCVGAKAERKVIFYI